VDKAESVGSANLLYDAAMSQGVVRMKGTLAVQVRADSVRAELSGEFGAPIGRYDGVELTGEKIRSVRIASRELRWLIAGIWAEGTPAVAGASADRVLLRWTDRGRAEGVLDEAAGALSSLRVERTEGDLEAVYGGARDPWPERIELREKRSGSALRLRLLAREPAS